MDVVYSMMNGDMLLTSMILITFILVILTYWYAKKLYGGVSAGFSVKKSLSVSLGDPAGLYELKFTQPANTIVTGVKVYSGSSSLSSGSPLSYQLGSASNSSDLLEPVLLTEEGAFKTGLMSYGSVTEAPSNAVFTSKARDLFFNLVFSGASTSDGKVTVVVEFKKI